MAKPVDTMPAEREHGGLLAELRKQRVPMWKRRQIVRKAARARRRKLDAL